MSQYLEFLRYIDEILLFHFRYCKVKYNKFVHIIDKHGGLNHDSHTTKSKLTYLYLHELEINKTYFLPNTTIKQMTLINEWPTVNKEVYIKTSDLTILFS